MNLTDVQLMLDITADRADPGIILKLSEPFLPDIHQLEKDGYFSMVNSVVLGDADTGELLFSYNKTHKDKTWDIIIPVVGIALVAFAYIEGAFQIVLDAVTV